MAYTLEVKAREKKPNPRELRRQGVVPGVVYGPGTSQAIAVNQKALEALMHQITRSSRIDLKLNGKVAPAFIKEIQYDELTDAPKHVDFYMPAPSRDVKINVPLRLKGEAKGRKEGGVVNQIRDLIKVKGPAGKIPELIEVDITELDMGKVLHVSDLRLEGGSALLPADAPIVSVVAPRKEEVVAPVPGVEGAVPGVEGAVPAEGAVPTEGAAAAPAAGAAPTATTAKGAAPAAGGAEKKK
jgi:large subunit ribosomal protein L25